MRKLIAAATFTLGLGIVGAAGAANDEQSPESRAYFGASFGGERAAPRHLHYGLRLDHDSRFLEGRSAPPLMQLDFTRRGLNDARVNGLSVLKQQYRMKQDDGETADEQLEAEEPGLFEGMWNGVTGFFGGLFGGDEEEQQVAEAEEEVVEETEEAPEDIAEGVFMGYNAVDWALLAVGAVGIGYISSEVANGEEDPDPTGSNGGNGGDGAIDPCDPDTFDPEGCVGGLGLATITASADDATRERLEWLDSGTGQMGDLHERPRH